MWQLVEPPIFGIWNLTNIPWKIDYTDACSEFLPLQTFMPIFITTEVYHQIRNEKN